LDLDDSKAEIAGPIELVADLSEIAAQCAASNLLDFAAQLAGLAEDLKALAARPIEPVPTLTGRRSAEAGFSSITLKIEPSRQ